jgi:hypothetical protein
VEDRGEDSSVHTLYAHSDDLKRVSGYGKVELSEGDSGAMLRIYAHRSIAERSNVHASWAVSVPESLCADGSANIGFELTPVWAGCDFEPAVIEASALDFRCP